MDECDTLFVNLKKEAFKSNPDVNLNLVESAYQLAKKAHSGAKRKTGCPYLLHPLGVVKILIEKNYARTEILCAALLHDVVEDTEFTQKDVEKATTVEVANLVQGLTKIKKQTVAFEKYKAENLRKILLATAKDVRVMIIKIADRIENLSSLGVFRREKQLRIAKETLDVYSPIAQKLGLYDFKAELEDMAFEYLDPEMFAFIKSKIRSSKAQRVKQKDALLDTIRSLLDDNSVTILEVSGRAKHLYSVYKKIKFHNKLFEQIYDLYGIRIICEREKECYAIHDLLKSRYDEIAERFKDYIKDPKPNGYQSIHANFVIDNKIAEIQIRTKQMDYQAESGLATHWKYKQTERDKKFDKKLNWLRQILKWRNSQNIRLDVEAFKDEIITVTPKGDPIVLREGSTPIDFAFAIHSGVGSYMRSAKVNGSIVPLNFTLTSGDIVEIETTKQLTVNQNWISMCKQTSTVAKIRKELGLEVEHASPKENRLRERKSQQSTATMENYYQTLSQFSDLAKKKIRIAKCCSPKGADPIVAFYTKGKKEIVVHKFDCSHQFALDQNAKVQIKEKQKKVKSHVTVHVIVKDQPGIVLDVLNFFLSHNFTIQRASSKDGKNNFILILDVVHKKGTDIQSELDELHKFEAVNGVKVV